MLELNGRTEVLARARGLGNAEPADFDACADVVAVQDGMGVSTVGNVGRGTGVLDDGETVMRIDFVFGNGLQSSRKADKLVGPVWQVSDRDVCRMRRGPGLETFDLPGVQAVEVSVGDVRKAAYANPVAGTDAATYKRIILI